MSLGRKPGTWSFQNRTYVVGYVPLSNLPRKKRKSKEYGEELGVLVLSEERWKPRTILPQSVKYTDVLKSRKKLNTYPRERYLGRKRGETNEEGEMKRKKKGYLGIILKKNRT